MFRSLSSSLIVNSASFFSDDLKSLYAAFNLVFISEISFWHICPEIQDELLYIKETGGHAVRVCL